MRLLASASLAATLLAGTPHPAVPPPPPGAFHNAMPPGVPSAPAGFKPTGHPDLLERVRITSLVVRGHVGAGATGIKDAYAVHVDRWLKGEGKAELVVDFGHQRPVTPEGGVEVLFLSRVVTDGGAGGVAPYRAEQATGEYYTVPDALVGALDQAVGDAVAGAPEDKLLRELAQLSPAIAVPAVSRLALLASHEPGALATAEATVNAPETNLEARVLLVTMVGSKLTPATVVALASGKEEHLSMAAIESLGRMAANEPARRAEAVPVLVHAGESSSSKLKLTAGLALANLGDARALPPLDAILASSEQPLRAEATRGLARLAEQGNTEAYDRLEKLTRDADPEVKSRATNLLKPLGARPASPPRPWVPLVGIPALAVVILVLVRRRRRAGQ